MNGASSESGTADPAKRLSDQIGRVRWIALHCAGRALRRRLDVEDLVQETLLRAWTAREHWPAPELGDAGLARWLAFTVRRTTIDAARASRAKKRDGCEQPLELGDFSRSGVGERELAAKTAGPLTRAGAAEVRIELERAFERLSGEHRRVLALRQFEGLSAAEAGARIGKSEVAVHSLYRRALQAWEREAQTTFSTLSGEPSDE